MFGCRRVQLRCKVKNGVVRLHLQLLALARRKPDSPLTTLSSRSAHDPLRSSRRQSSEFVARIEGSALVFGRHRSNCDRNSRITV